MNYSHAERIYTPFGLYDFNDLANRSDYRQAQTKRTELNLIFGGQNLLDTEYIEQSSTNIPEGNPKFTSYQVYYGMDRTWFVVMKVQF